MRKRLIAGLMLFLVATVCLAQRGNRFRYRDSQVVDFNVERFGVPDWETDEEFPEDVFTFVRVMYNAQGNGWGKWRTDWPHSDLNFSYRLQQLTSLKVNPNPIYLELTDPRLFDYPWIYIVEPGANRDGPG